MTSPSKRTMKNPSTESGRSKSKPKAAGYNQQRPKNGEGSRRSPTTPPLLDRSSPLNSMQTGQLTSPRKKTWAQGSTPNGKRDSRSSSRQGLSPSQMQLVPAYDFQSFAYAGSKFSDPPSPKVLPKPPTHWVSDESLSPTMNSNCADMTSHLKMMLNVHVQA